MRLYALESIVLGTGGGLKTNKMSSIGHKELVSLKGRDKWAHCDRICHVFPGIRKHAMFTDFEVADHSRRRQTLL